MSKVAKVISAVAAVVATVAEIAFLVTGNPIFATVAAVASAVAAVSGVAAQLLQKPPDMKGTVNEVVIGANMPVPYAMGRTYVGGMKVYDDSQDDPAGGDNKDRNQIFVGSHAGPIDGFEKFLADYSPITFATESGGLISGVASGYYGADGGYLWLNTRKGERPDTALTATGGRVAPRGWTSAHKLSGMACWLVDMEFDEDGERWAAGIPAFGMVAKWVLVYDPRLDSTYPGGSGAQRWDDESTWAWSENPGLHALTYARGRFMGAANVKVVGAGIPKDAIDIAAFVELANVCDANGWTLGGAVYEGPGTSKWDNLKRILAPAAAEPAWVGGRLSCRISAPKVALYTLTVDDLADGEIEVQAMASWKDRINTVVPRVRLETHKWDYQQLDAVTEPTYLIEDGETKTEEVQFDLCQKKNQGAQLAAYMIVNRREFGPIRINAKPHMMAFRPGDAIEIDLPEAGIEGQLAAITARTVDPASGSVQLELYSETTAKHAWALSRTGVAPPTPTIVSPVDVDAAVSSGAMTLADIQTALRNTFAKSGFTPTAIDAGSSATIQLHGPTTADNFVIDYPGNHDATIAPTNITGKSYGTTYYLYGEVSPSAGPGDPAPTFGATTVYADAINSSAHPYRFFLARSVTTPAAGGGGTTGSGTGGGAGGGYGGSGSGPYP